MPDTTHSIANAPEFCAICRSLPASLFVFREYPGQRRRFVAFTDDIRHYTGCTPQQLLEDEALLWRCIDRRDARALDRAGREAVERLETRQLECRLNPRGDSQSLWVNIAMRPQRLEDGTVLVVGLLSNATERKRLEASLHEQEHRFANTARNIPGAVFRYLRAADGSDRVEYMSPGCEALWEVPAEAVVNDAGVLWQMVLEEDLPEMLATVRHSAESLTPWRHKWRIRTPSGRIKWLEAAGQPEYCADGSGVWEDGTTRWDAVIIDVTERVLAEERGRELAQRLECDSLTGLPNRPRLEERLQLALQRRVRADNGGFFAVVTVDLDRFRVVNDSLGHDAGDRILRHVAALLGRGLRAGDFLCHPGGDEYILLLEDLDSLDELLHVLQRLDSLLREPLDIAGQSLAASASMGVVLSRAHYRDASEMLRDATIALHRAKHDQRNFYALFDAAMHEQAVMRLQTEADLRLALDRDELLVYYQPIVAPRTGRVAGVEALVRWQHPQRGLVLPGEFIGIGEETGLVRDIDRQVLRRALYDLQRWTGALGDRAPGYISVNVSARDLAGADCIGFLDSAIAGAALQPHRVQLEITESMLIDDFQQARETLYLLSQRGFRIGLDDFGTGYSSLSYLHRLPVDTLKADRSFIHNAARERVARGILETLSVLATSLRLPIIAEGVETPEQLELVRGLGYPLVQGYLYSPPLSEPELVEWLARNAHAPDGPM